MLSSESNNCTSLQVSKYYVVSGWLVACICRQEQQQGSSPLEQQSKTKTDTGLNPEQLQEVSLTSG
jgi:hypothetical protein